MEIQKYIPRLKKMMSDSKIPELSAAVAQLLKRIDVSTSSRDEVELNLAILKGVRFELEAEGHKPLVARSDGTAENFSVGKKAVLIDAGSARQ